MLNNIEKIKPLEQTGTLRILLVLKTNEEEEMRPGTIQKSIIISNDPYYTARNNLIDLKLIEKVNDKYKSVSYFKLTDKGKKVADHLIQILSLLK